MSYIKERTCLMLDFIIYVILVLIIFNNGPILTGFLIGIALLAVIVCLKDINSVHNYISTKSKKETDTIVVVDESKIVFKNNNEHVAYEFEWDYVKYIIISKYCISVISANEENTSFVISIPIDYKEECLRIFEKYNKMDLIVENKKRKKIVIRKDYYDIICIIKE